MNKGSENWALKNRCNAITISVTLFFLIGIVMTYHLWLPSHLRDFPQIPYFKIVEYPNPLIGISVLVILVASLFINLFKRSRVLFSLIVFSIVYLGFEDQLRWQPWVYLYLIVFFCLAIVTDKSNPKDIFLMNFVQILLVGIYLWSGIHKINESFIDQTFSSIARSFFSIRDSELIVLKPIGGYVIPCVEIICGLVLIFPKTRLMGVVLSVVIHLSIIIYISPLGINSNYIVVPWNCAMIVLVVISFYKTENQLFLEMIPFPYRFIRYTIFLLFWIMPLFNFFSLWDGYLSFSLYSDKNSGYYIAIEQSQIHKIDKKLIPFFVKIPNLTGGEVIDVNKWALTSLNVPFYPENRVFKKLSTHFCKLGIDNEKIVFLEVSNYPIKGQYIPFRCR